MKSIHYMSMDGFYLGYKNSKKMELSQEVSLFLMRLFFLVSGKTQFMMNGTKWSYSGELDQAGKARGAGVAVSAYK